MLVSPVKKILKIAPMPSLPLPKSIAAPLIKNEEQITARQKGQSTALWVGRVADWDATQLTERQKQVIALYEDKRKDEKNKQLRIVKLYELLHETNLLLLTISRVDLLLTATGWVSLLTGVLNVDALADLVNKHGNTCSEILTLEPTDPIFRERAGMALIEKHAGTGFQLACGAIKNSNSLIALRDERLLKKIGAFISGNIEGLLLLQSQLKCQIIDKAKFNLLYVMPSSSDAALLTSSQNNYKKETPSKDEILALNILNLKVNITSLPKNYTTILPDGKEILVESVEEASGDGNCGFRAILGDAYLSQATNLLSRQGVVELLLEYLVQPQVKAFIAKDIKAKYNEYISNLWSVEDTKLFPEKLKKKFDNFKAKTIEVGKAKLLKQKIKLEKIDESINKYFLKEKTLKRYLKQFLIHKTIWPHAQGCLAAFGQILQIKVHCLQLQEPDGKHTQSWLRYIDLEQNNDLNYKEEVYIILNQQGTHFNRLKIKIVKINNQLMSLSVANGQPSNQEKKSRDNKLLKYADNLLPIAKGLITHKSLPPKPGTLYTTPATVSSILLKSVQNKPLWQLFKSNIYTDMTKSYKEVAETRQQERASRENQYKELALHYVGFWENDKNLAQLCIKNDVNGVKIFLSKFKNKQERAKIINDSYLENRNAFHCACVTNNTVLMQLLLDNGADILKPCLQGYYAIHHVILSQHNQNEQILIALNFLKKCNPALIEVCGNRGDSFSRKPLHIAAHM